MKKRICLLLLLVSLSAVCFSHDFLEAGGTMIWSQTAIRDKHYGGGVNLAVFPHFTDNFGLGMFLNFASAPVILDFIIGPFYGFSITDKFSLMLSAGLYAGIIFVGGGGGITLQYAIHPNWSVYTRVQCTYASFLAPGTNGVQSLIVSPCLGIGYRF